MKKKAAKKLSSSSVIVDTLGKGIRREPPAKPPAVRYEGGGTDQLIAMAIDKDLDMDKLERLIAMKDREEEKTAKSYFDIAMAKVQSDIEPIIADAENDHTNSMYARLSTIVGTLAPIYAGEGFSVSFGTEDCKSEKLVNDGWFRTTAELSHVGGFSKHYFVDLPADTVGSGGTINKTLIHGTKSTITYSRGILMGLMFNFTTSMDVDNDGNSLDDKILPEDAAILRDQLEAVGGEEEFFCDWLRKGIKSFDDVPATLLGKAKKAISEQAAARK